MSESHQYLSKNNTSFFSVDDDVDDEEFLRHPPSGRCNMLDGANVTENVPSRNLQDFHQEQLHKRREIQNRMVETSQRSLSVLRDTEEIGVSTAEELLRQREGLERTEKRLDEINSTLRFSQKHIQGIKSVFGSFKNYLSGKTETKPNVSKLDTPKFCASQTLLDAVEHTKPLAGASQDHQAQDHPGLRVRGLVPESRQTHEVNDPENIIDENLSQIVNSITRLKGLAHGLGEEIDSQNDLVENIIDKTERADITLKRQNKDMSRLLK